MRVLGFGGGQISEAAGGYNVDNSLRFNDGSSDSLSDSFSSPSSRDTFTVSAWVKMTGGGGANQIPIVSFDGSSQYMTIRFSTTFKFDVISYQGGTTGRLISNAFYRDYSAWYHIVASIDSTQATSSNRMKLYVNGEQITSFATANYPSQNTDMISASMTSVRVGAGVDQVGTTSYYDGYMAEVCYIDGTALDPTSFGEFDEDSGIWKPIDVSGLTFGTNGFYLPFENSAALGQDDSGNGNNFTVNNLTSIDQTTDTPTNNYCTFNPLDVTADDEPTLSEGNLKAVADGAFHQQRSTFYLTKGKWYWEFKATSVGTAFQGGVVGSNYAGGVGLRRNYQNSGAKYIDGSSSSYGATFTNGDIIGVALDLDNGTLIFYKNGVSQGTAFTDMLSAIGQDGWTPDALIYNSTVEMNFGNPPFTISSGNSDGNGYGNFEYSVPSGYYALNTKNLAEYG